MRTARNYQHRWANQSALRTAAAATLALILVISIPYHPQAWFGWFASFSVVIVTLMFPHENQNHKLLWERFISMSFTVLLCLTLLYLFKNNTLLFSLILMGYGLWCMYNVGNHHTFHYAMFLSMIFIGLSAGISLLDRNIAIDLWQLPASVLVALFAVVCIDFVLKPNLSRRTILRIDSDWQQHFSTLSPSQALPYDSVSLLNTLLINAKSQFCATQWRRLQQRYYLYRILTLKHNLVAQHYAKIEATPIKHRISSIYAHLADGLQSYASAHAALQACRVTEYLFYCQAIRNEDAWLCLNECQLMAEDVLQLHAPVKATHNNPATPSQTPQKTFNLDAFKYGLKTVVAVALSLLLVHSLSLPGGVQTIIATTVTAGAPNIGASIQKMLLRTLGVVLGCLAGFIVLTMLASTASIAIYLVSTFAFVFFCSRWSLTSSHFSYAGIQSALMFIIMVSNTGMQAINLSLPGERFYGVLVGSLIAFAVVSLLAPVKPRDTLNAGIKSILAELDRCWHNLTQSRCNTTSLQQTLQGIDQKLKNCNQALFEQRFLMTDLPAQQEELDHLQHINDCLKLINRLLRSHAAQSGNIQRMLQHVHVDFQAPGTPIKAQSLQAPHSGIHAKLDYCLQQLQHHWSAIKLSHLN